MRGECDHRCFSSEKLCNCKVIIRKILPRVQPTKVYKNPVEAVSCFRTSLGRSAYPALSRMVQILERAV